MKNALTVLSSTEAPTMSSVEMVEYINALAAAADKADSIQELDKCLRLIEDFRRSVSVSYHPICKVIYCHVNSLICQKSQIAKAMIMNKGFMSSSLMMGS